MCLHTDSLVKTEANVWENSRADVEGFHPLLLKNSHKLCQGFHEARKARRTCFISFTKWLFSVLTKRKMINEACMYSFNSFMKMCINSYNLETTNHFAASISCFKVLLKQLVDQSKRTYYPNYFIKYNEGAIIFSDLLWLYTKKWISEAQVIFAICQSFHLLS